MHRSKTMIRIKLAITFFVGGCILPFLVAVAQTTPTISLSPAASVLPGEPIFITLTSNSPLKSLKFNGQKIPAFTYLGKVRALIGLDLNQKPGNYPVLAEFQNKKTATTSIQILPREKVAEPLGIPEKLGGNTTSSAANLVSDLTSENYLISHTRTYPKSLWTKAFKFPITKPIVTDPYGYSRETSGYTIAHKGTDFRATVGTPVLAMNRGIVRLARTFRIYGRTIVVDHGQGVQTLYMHLSKINVNEGQLVARGEIIGKSGQTGYAESPHLHLSVRIQDVSVDPIKFMELFK